MPSWGAFFEIKMNFHKFVMERIDIAIATSLYKYAEEIPTDPLFLSPSIETVG